jgi:UDP-glucose 4-epimerase
MEQLVAGGRRIELGNLNPKRDYIHVRDIADALVVLAATEPSAELDVFNIGSGTEHTVSELVAMCAEILGEPVEVATVESRRRKFDRPSQLADISRLCAHTGWSPSRGVKRALEELLVPARAGG